MMNDCRNKKWARDSCWASFSLEFTSLQGRMTVRISPSDKLLGRYQTCELI